MSQWNQVPASQNPYTGGPANLLPGIQGTPIIFQDPIPFSSGVPHSFEGASAVPNTAGTLDEPVLETIVPDLHESLVKFYI